MKLKIISILVLPIALRNMVNSYINRLEFRKQAWADNYHNNSSETANYNFKRDFMKITLPSIISKSNIPPNSSKNILHMYIHLIFTKIFFFNRFTYFCHSRVVLGSNG